MIESIWSIVLCMAAPVVRTVLHTSRSYRRRELCSRRVTEEPLENRHRSGASAGPGRNPKVGQGPSPDRSFSAAARVRYRRVVVDYGLGGPDEYFELARRDLAQLLSAEATTRQLALAKATMRETPQTTLLRVPGGTHVVSLHRGSLAFTTSEMALTEAYANALDGLHSVPRDFAPTAATDLLTRAIAVRCAQGRPERSAELELVLRTVLEHAMRTYEGVRVAANICVALGVNDSGQALPDFLGEPWAAVLGSGLNTGVKVSGNGDVLRVFDLPTPAENDGDAPERFLAVAHWTTEHAGRVGFSVTRTGETYVFVNGAVLFVHRGGRWKGFPVDGVLGTGWFSDGTGLPRTTKRAVLHSLLDASAAHHGACVGILHPARDQTVALDRLVAEDARWSSVANTRRSVFRQTNFLQLSRRRRLELLSMDGATILDRDATILAAGAILKVRGGSTGGGRSAAAAAISRHGVGIKVSQDGPITAMVDRAVRFEMG